MVHETAGLWPVGIDNKLHNRVAWDLIGYLRQIGFSLVQGCI